MTRGGVVPIRQVRLFRPVCTLKIHEPFQINMAAHSHGSRLPSSEVWTTMMIGMAPIRTRSPKTSSKLKGRRKTELMGHTRCSTRLITPRFGGFKVMSEPRAQRSYMKSSGMMCLFHQTPHVQKRSRGSQALAWVMDSYMSFGQGTLSPYSPGHK